MSDNNDNLVETDSICTPSRKNVSHSYCDNSNNMCKAQNRLKTFEERWNKWHIDPLELTRAGFYYIGISNCVKCFSCGVGLEDWNITDNIWLEHAFWSPHCQHVKNVKGDEFVENIMRNWFEHSRISSM